MAQQDQNWNKQWGQIVARAWSDEAFKQRLLREPAAVLKEAGAEVRPGTKVKVLEQTSDELYLLLPPRPSSEISEEDLAEVAGGIIFVGGRQADKCIAAR